MGDYIFYDESGQIRCVCSMNYETRVAMPESPYFVMPGIANPLTDYVLDGKVMPRPGCPAQLSGTTLINLPVPCTITINNSRYECADDHAELSFTEPGLYRIGIISWPYLNKTFTYENPAQ